MNTQEPITPPLTVYKASAGSGKTFTLAVNFITLLIVNPDDAFRRILAVTFTNKATQEMKMRVLSQLYGIAKGLDSSKAYLACVRQNTHLPDSEIASRAWMALTRLLHHYSEFRIETIDAFFQGVLRNLAHELGLSANLRTELNDEEVEADAVDDMIQNLSPRQQELRWITDYIDHSINDNNQWNVIPQIKAFGKNIFEQNYKDNRDDLDKLFAEPDFFKHYEDKLYATLRSAWEKPQQQALDIMKAMDEAGLTNPELYNKTVYNYISLLAEGTYVDEKIRKNSRFDPTAGPGSTVAKAIGSSSKWGQSKLRKAEKEAVKKMVESHDLCSQLASLETARKEAYALWQSARLTLSHLPQLRLLHSIADAVEKDNREAGRFMLSDTQSLLAGMMEGSDTPFIFEKIGARLEHIMIDEFQDTSTTQWQNFRVLLENCMAQAGSRDLIVGDVKQSIYRWRHGDWRLLNSIEDQFHEGQLSVKPLKVNYRSQENIVTFNNVFFQEAVKATDRELKGCNIPGREQLLRAYADNDLIQKPNKEGRQGQVSITLYPHKDNKQNRMQLMVDTIAELMEKGVSERDIAILVRSRTPIPDIVKAINDSGLDVHLVSDEAFRLDASLPVNIIISALRLLTHPDDLLTRGRLVQLTAEMDGTEAARASQLFVVNKAVPVDIINAGRAAVRQWRDKTQIEKLNESLPKAFTRHRAELLQLSMTDLIDRLFSIFHLDSLDDQSAYICSFYDVLSEYLRDHPADIDDFLEEWKQTLYKKTIESDEIDGIRIITIHKSKGLEFDNVIMPDISWKFESSRHKSTLWSKPKNVKPFNELPVIPVDYNRKQMVGTVYEDDYLNEHMQQTVDNMNMLYVAFTRASRNLFVMGERMAKKNREKLAEGGAVMSSTRSQVMDVCLPQVAQRLSGSILTGYDSDDEPLSFSYGQLSIGAQKEEEASGNPFETSEEPHKIKISTFPWPVEFRQSNKSRDFVSGDDENPTDRQQYIRRGNVLHQLFATINTLDDVEPQLRNLELDGIIGGDGLQADDLRHDIEAATHDAQVADWFSGRWRLFNECTILEYDPQTATTIEHRPDRVMTDGKRTIVVDFKFGHPYPEYHDQVARYMSLLGRMGYQGIEGYLWYVLQGKIEKVNLNNK